jgi:hypothetical protein
MAWAGAYSTVGIVARGGDDPQRNEHQFAWLLNSVQRAARNHVR